MTICCEAIKLYCRKHLLHSAAAVFFAGMLLGIMTIFGIIENFSVFAMFVKNRKELSSRTTHMLMSLCLSDGIMAMVGGTMYTISSLNHNWPFGYAGNKVLWLLQKQTWG